MTDNITDFIKASIDDKPVAAFNSLKDELGDRIATSLDDFKVSVTKNMFNVQDSGESDE